MKITIIGAGSWGTALALKSYMAGNETWLYERLPLQAEEVARTRYNALYLPHVYIPEDIHITSDKQEAMQEADIVLIVTPSQFVREALVSIKEYLTKDMIVCCCAKGLEKATGMRLSEVMYEVIGDITSRIVILSGPNHAEEISQNLPATTVVASKDCKALQMLQQALHSDTFRVYTNEDIVGVELGGTTKNIIALAAGCVAGLGLGDNILSALMTRGLHEMTRFGVHYGAKSETFAGLSGMGDLITTCMSQNSRNRRAGMALAQGKTKDEILADTCMVVEGFHAVEAVYKEAQKHHIDMPITQAIFEVLSEKASVKEVLFSLMTRDPKNETQGLKL